jgi:hypothetical protein
MQWWDANRDPVGDCSNMPDIERVRHREHQHVSAARGRRAGGHISAHRYAVERPRDAPSPSGWPRVPGRPGISSPKVETQIEDVRVGFKFEPPMLRLPTTIPRLPRIGLWVSPTLPERGVRHAVQLSFLGTRAWELVPGTRVTQVLKVLTAYTFGRMLYSY